MPEDHGVVRRIAWRQVCPWLIIFRCFRLSTSLPILFLATVGTLVTPLGWRAAEWLFVPDSGRGDAAFAVRVERNSQWPMTGPPATILPATGEREGFPWNRLVGEDGSLGHVYWRYATPFYQLLEGNFGVRQFAYWTFGAIWLVVVWGLLGGAITRLAAVSLGRDERLGLGESLRHVLRNYLWYVLAPWFPIIGLLACAIPVILLGWLMQTNIGVLVAGVLWPLVLLFSLVLVVFVIGLMFGWPMLFPTISSEEGSDAFEAFSRTYAYTYQRPLHYLFYATVAVLFGGLSWIFVAAVAEGVIWMSAWALAWGGGGERTAAIFAGELDTGLPAAGSYLIRMWNDLVRSIATAFNFAFFWTAATAIYLLLRRDVDQTELDEVFVEDESQRYGLPPLPAVERIPRDEAATAADKSEGTGAAAPDENSSA